MNEITDPAAGIVAQAAFLVKKTCTKCGAEKVLGEFHLNKMGKFGRRSRCKVCECAYARGHMRAYMQRPGVKERQWAYQQRPEYKAYQQEYRKRPEARECWRTYARDRRHNDLDFKLVSYLRTRILDALKGGSKSARTLELLGCTVEELRAHLEAQFKPGMTWENQGRYGWHIDHIRPCASFDLTDPEQQRACFHYTNLQPLWAEENLRKGAKLLDTTPTA